jgi:WD40 repeat protein
MARYALVVGITEYDNRNFLPNLNKPAIDAEAVAQFLEKTGMFKEVERLPNRWIPEEKRYEITPGRVTSDQMYDALKKILQGDQTRNQEVWIYFSGHGFRTANRSGNKHYGYLATSDSRLDSINAVNAISLNDDLNELLSQSSLSNLVVLLDCCHAGALLDTSLELTRNAIEPNLPDFTQKQRDYFLITACRAEQVAWEDEEYSLFTAALLKGLAPERADATTGEVKVGSLLDCIDTHLAGKGQESVFMGRGRSIVLVKYDAQSRVQKRKPKEILGKIVCPYQGLEAFTANEREFFFGRKRVVESIKQKLDQSNFVPVIGASGSGKSSVVRAGLMPWLEDLGWEILPAIKPGIKPLARLEEALKEFFEGEENESFLDDCINNQENTAGLVPLMEQLPDSKKFLLVVDQFEELFTVSQLAQRDRFMSLITQVPQIPNSRLAIVITMRADFLEPFLCFPALHGLIEANHAEFMPPLTDMELREIIQEPAKRQGYEVEEALVLAILEDIGKEPGFLPLLEFALTKLWEERDEDKHTLTLAKYLTLGRLPGALNQYADRIYQYRDYEKKPPQERDELEKDWIRRIFLRLVRTGEGEKDTRQRQFKMNLLSIAGDDLKQQTALERLLDSLVKGRLLVTGTEADNEGHQEAIVDLAHEALMQGWNQFVAWRLQDRDLRRLSDRLADVRREWQKTSTDENLMMGGLLAAVKDDWEALQPYLQAPKADREFYERSQELRTKQKREEERRKKQAIEGETRALIALSNFRFLSNDSMGALFAAVKAAIRLKQENWMQSTELNILAQEALQQVVGGNQERNRLEGDEPLYCVKFSPDGKLIAAGDGGKVIHLWQTDGTPITTLVGHTERIENITFSSDNRMIASASEDTTIRVWELKDSQTYIQKYLLQGHEKTVNDINFSLDNKILASASSDGTLKLWDLNNGELILTIDANSGSTDAVSFSPTEPIIASGGWDNPPWQGKIKLWKLDGTPINTFDVNTGVLRSIQFSTDGSMIVFAGDSALVGVLRVVDGQIITALEKAHDNWAMGASISPDNQTIASVSTDKAVKLWSLGGQLQKILHGHNDAIYGLTFSPDGKTLATASTDKTMRLWNVDGLFLKSISGEPNSAHFCVRFSQKGEMLATASWDSSLRGWIVKLWHSNGELIRTLPARQEYYSTGDNRITTVEFNHDGSLVVAASWDGTAKVWNLDGELITNFTGHGRSVEGEITYDDRPCINGVSFSPKGDLLASGGYDRHIRFWNLQGKELAIIPNPHRDGIYRMCFSPDGEILATASWDRTVKLWSVNDRRLIKTFTGHSNWLYGLNFSPDGQMLVSSSLDKTIKLWSTYDGLIKTITGHTDGVHDVCFSPDGKLIASAGLDNTVKIWSIDGTLLKTLTGHYGAVHGVSFSYPDGQIIASASWDGSIKFWSTEILDFDGLLNQGCSMLQDYLKSNPNISPEDRNLCDGFILK